MVGHECEYCVFVANTESIALTPALKRKLVPTFWELLCVSISRRRYDDAITSVGKFTMPQWSGHATFYAFFCPDCREIRVDYLHGHHHYLACGECDFRWHVLGRRFYADTGMPMPPWLMTRKERRELQAKIRVHRNRLP